MTPEQQDRLRSAAQAARIRWGQTAQMNQLQEECGEAVNAVAVYRSDNSAPNLGALLREIADVIICTEQMKIALGEVASEVVRPNRMTEADWLIAACGNTVASINHLRRARVEPANVAASVSTLSKAVDAVVLRFGWSTVEPHFEEKLSKLEARLSA